MRRVEKSSSSSRSSRSSSSSSSSSSSDVVIVSVSVSVKFIFACQPDPAKNKLDAKKLIFFSFLSPSLKTFKNFRPHHRPHELQDN